MRARVVTGVTSADAVNATDSNGWAGLGRRRSERGKGKVKVRGQGRVKYSHPARPRSASESPSGSESKSVVWPKHAPIGTVAVFRATSSTRELSRTCPKSPLTSSAQVSVAFAPLSSACSGAGLNSSHHPRGLLDWQDRQGAVSCSRAVM